MLTQGLLRDGKVEGVVCFNQKTMQLQAEAVNCVWALSHFLPGGNELCELARIGLIWGPTSCQGGFDGKKGWGYVMCCRSKVRV